MKNEMIKFVDENFHKIKTQFLNDEIEILKEMLEDGVFDLNDFESLKDYLIKQMNVSTSEELINVINERSIGVDLDSNESVELFNMIKAIIKG